MIVLLLAVAAAAAFVMGDVIEGTAVIAVLLINGAIGFGTEMRAIRSMESLQEITEIESRVRRAGDDREIPAEDLVPGDIVVLDAGDIVPADLRV
ncbi:MAG: haloacid dehalogenase, partial [Halolamina sp.]